MSLLWIDSLDSYTATADMQRWYSGEFAAVAYSASQGRDGGNSIVVMQTTTGGIDGIKTPVLRTSSGNGDRVSCAFVVRKNGNPVGLCAVMGWANDSMSENGIIRVTSSGYIAVSRWGASVQTLILTNTLVNVCDNLPHWVEVDVVWHTGASGSARISVDGGSVVEVTGVITANTTPSPTRFGPHYMAQSNLLYYVDDLVAYDDVDNGDGFRSSTKFPLGIRYIDTLRPSGAGTSTQFTPSAGANYAAVDEVVGNTDTDYVESETNGHRDTYAFGNPATAPTSVDGLMVKALAKNAGSGTAKIKGAALSGGDIGYSPTKNLTGAYAGYCLAINQDPDTSAAWTASAINAAEFGFEKTA